MLELYKMSIVTESLKPVSKTYVRSVSPATTGPVFFNNSKSPRSDMNSSSVMKREPSPISPYIHSHSSSTPLSPADTEGSISPAAYTDRLVANDCSPIQNTHNSRRAETIRTMPVINVDPNSLSVCSGCFGKIVDRYYLLAVDKKWHVQCLKCCECKIRLDTELTCFAKDGSIYCKEDYYRRFSVKRCARCQLGISAREMVMRAKDLVFHLNCFTCITCNKALTTGDQFGMRDNMVFCRNHYEMALQEDFGFGAYGLQNPAALGSGTPPPGTTFYNGVGAAQKGRPRKRKNPPDECHPGILGMHQNENENLDAGFNSNQPRQKRMRTSFKHHQLRAMKSYFSINHNPDAKDLKQLAQKTGLTKRVLQVWFQNARAKFRRNMLKEQSQQSSGQSQGSDTGLSGLAPNSSSSETHDLDLDHVSTTSLTELSTNPSPTLPDLTSPSLPDYHTNIQEENTPQTTLSDMFS